MAILLQHQDHLRAAMQLTNHPPSVIDGASALIVNLNRRHKRSGTAYPFQQDEITAAINRCAKNAVKKSTLQPSHHGHPTRVQTWQCMLTAKYTHDGEHIVVEHGTRLRIGLFKAAYLWINPRLEDG